MLNLFAIPLHHGEPGDPDLFVWIRDRLDNMTSLEPQTIAAILVLIVVAIPVTTLGFYFFHRRDH